jgi:hypothetical protein
MLYANGAFARLLSRKEVLLKTSSPTLEGERHLLKLHGEELAKEAQAFRLS